MSVFRFRAECSLDVENLIAAIVKYREPSDSIETMEVTTTRKLGIPDVEVQIATSISIERLRSFIVTVTDGHTMAETLKPAGDYDGRRSYIGFDDHGKEFDDGNQ